MLEYRIDPSGRRVVFRADAETRGLVALYSTPLGGSRAPARLSRPLVPGGDVQSFQISADGRRVAFTSDLRTDARQLQLLTGPVGGEEKAVEVAGPFAGFASVQAYALSADGSVVAWSADQETPGVVELFAARTEAASKVRRP